MSSWLNLREAGLGRDCRKQIYSWLNVVDRLMVEVAHCGERASFWCQHSVAKCEGMCKERARAYSHKGVCRRNHNKANPQCNWNKLKIGCAKYGFWILKKYIEMYPILHSNHPDGYDLFVEAMLHNQTAAIANLRWYYKTGDGSFTWYNRRTGTQILTSHVSRDVTVDTIKWLRSEGVMVGHECYDSALACENFAIAEYLESVVYTCWCGVRSRPDSGCYGTCGPRHQNMIEGMGILIRVFPWGFDSWTPVFKDLNMKVANHLNSRGATIIAADALHHLKDWLSGDLRTCAELSAIVEWLEARGIDIRSDNFSFLYIIAAGFRKPNSVYDPKKIFPTDVSAIKYLISKECPITTTTFSTVGLIDRELYTLLRTKTTEILSADCIVEHASPEFIFEWEFLPDDINHDLLVRIWNRKLYDTFDKLYRRFQSLEAGKIKN